MKLGIQILVLMSALGLIDVRSVDLRDDNLKSDVVEENRILQNNIVPKNVNIPTEYSESPTLETEYPSLVNRTCSHFNSTFEKTSLFLPSNVLTVTCGCYESSQPPEENPVACPTCAISSNLNTVNIFENTILKTPTSCLSTIKVKLEYHGNDKKWFVNVSCSTDSVPPRKWSFQHAEYKKANNKEECQFTSDCANKDQVCRSSGINRKICSCPDDRPFFVSGGGVTGCKKGIRPGEHCSTTAECKGIDTNTYCNDFCECVHPYERNGIQCVSKENVEEKEKKSNTLTWVLVGVGAFALVILVAGVVAKLTGCLKVSSQVDGKNKGLFDSSYDSSQPSPVGSPASSYVTLRNIK